MILGMLPYICIWLVVRDLIAAAPQLDGSDGNRQIWLDGVWRSSSWHRRLFCRIDVYASGCFSYGIQYPKGRNDASDEGSIRLF